MSAPLSWQGSPSWGQKRLRHHREVGPAWCLHSYVRQLANFHGSQEPSGKRRCTDVKGRIGALLRLGEVNDHQWGEGSERGKEL